MMTNSMIQYKTTFESTFNLPMMIAIGHGENADLVASFTDDGVEVNLSGFTARAIYQPKSKWGTDDWYECNCEIDENTVIAHWGNTYDNGDDAVKLFMHLLKDGKLAYPAIYQIRLFATPGFTPSAVEPIPEVLDFSQYTLLNAPWALLSDFKILSGDASTLRNDVNSLSTALSGKANSNAVLANSGTPFLNGSLMIGNIAESPDAIEYRNDGIKIYPGTGNQYQVTMPLSAGQLALNGDVNLLNSELSSLSTTVGNLASAIGDVSERIRYAQTSTLITQNNQNVQLYEREDRGITVLSDSVASNIILSLPTKDADFVGDFIVDIDNRKQSALSVNLNGDPSAFYWFAVDDGETLSSVTSIEGGKISRLYFSTTGILREYLGLPLAVIHISKMVIDVVGHSEV